jgi:hypothetical protein
MTPVPAIYTPMPTKTTNAPVQATPYPSNLPTAAAPDEEAPTPPGTPYTVEVTAISISLAWEPSTDNIAVTRYVIFDGNNPLTTSRKPSITLSGLEPGSDHLYSITAVDALGNESPASDTLVVSTLILVDSFEDGDLYAEAGWGSWQVAHGGTKGDGLSQLTFNVPGYEGGLAAQLLYVVDSGQWGFANVYLDFAGGQTIDLTESSIVGVRFKMNGTNGSSFRLQLGTPLAEINWMYWGVDLSPTQTWTSVEVMFEDLKAKPEIPYTKREALAAVSTMVWETTTVGAEGYLLIDDIEFLTPTSTISALRSPESASGTHVVVFGLVTTLLSTVWLLEGQL